MKRKRIRTLVTQGRPIRPHGGPLHSSSQPTNSVFRITNRLLLPGIKNRQPPLSTSELSHSSPSANHSLPNKTRAIMSLSTHLARRGLEAVRGMHGMMSEGPDGSDGHHGKHEVQIPPGPALIFFLTGLVFVALFFCVRPPLPGCARRAVLTCIPGQLYLWPCAPDAVHDRVCGDRCLRTH
jgi:hypothetical protein